MAACCRVAAHGLGALAGRHAPAAKLHVAFSVFKANPIAQLTAGSASERVELRHFVQPGGFYVFDRGYTDYEMFQELHDRACSFVGRVQDNVAYKAHRERPLMAADRAAAWCGMWNCVVWVRRTFRLLPQPFRLVWVATGKHALMREEILILVTNRLDLRPN